MIDRADWRRWVQALQSTIATAAESLDPDVQKLRGEIVDVFDTLDLETINCPGHEEEWVKLRLVMSHGRALALLLKKERDLAALAPLIEFGAKFKLGRPESPFREPIAELLAGDSTMTNIQIWKALDAKPPKALKGWKFFNKSMPLGRYAEGPDPATDKMGYARFSEIAKEERDKARASKTSGDSDPRSRP